MANRVTRSPLVAVLLVLLVVGALWLLDDLPQTSSDPDPAPAPQGQATSSASEGSSRESTSPAGRDPASGLRWVDVDDLPAEAADTLELIDDGGPYPYDRDGVVFGNFEGILPDHQRGYYHEYTVPTPGEDDRGARRIVTGDADELYYPGDHYESFERIAR